MIGNVYKVIDTIESMDIRRRLDKLKNEIKNDSAAQRLIKNFNEAKELYGKYNIKDNFVNSKKELMSNPLISNYLEIQNEINMLSLYINNKINGLIGNKK